MSFSANVGRLSGSVPLFLLLLALPPPFDVRSPDTVTSITTKSPAITFNLYVPTNQILLCNNITLLHDVKFLIYSKNFYFYSIVMFKYLNLIALDCFLVHERCSCLEAQSCVTLLTSSASVVGPQHCLTLQRDYPCSALEIVRISAVIWHVCIVIRNRDSNEICVYESGLWQRISES